MRETEGRDSCGNLIPPLLSSDGHGQPAASFFLPEAESQVPQLGGEGKVTLGSFALAVGDPVGSSHILLQSGSLGPASEGLQTSLWGPGMDRTTGQWNISVWVPSSETKMGGPV